MRIRIRHEMAYGYDEPAKWTIQNLRMTPRDYDGQHVGPWRIEIDNECRLREAEDAFGNRLHRLTTEGPIHAIKILVEGEVTTFDTAGVASGAIERLPNTFFLRETPLTAPDARIAALVHEATAGAGATLDRLHRLLSAVHRALEPDTDTKAISCAPHAQTASEALLGGRGAHHDYAHLFIAGARMIGAPARYVSGYLLRGEHYAEASGHAWAEAWVEDLGWVGFDPAQGVSPGESYVRIAIAPDSLGAAPIRAARMGGGGEQIDVRLEVTNAALSGRIGSVAQ